ncbi:MAG: Hsp33 family molecular chaperone HslO [Cyanophyceae cyanobacterium]
MSDRLIRAIAADGGIRVVGTITTQLTEEARCRHGLSRVATAALGRTMTAGLLLVSNMKHPDSRVNLRFKGDGPLGGILADAGLDGTVRGYVGNPTVEVPPKPNGKLDVGAAVGRGFLHSIRELGYGRPFSSTTEIISGEIGDDVANFLINSEQTPSALSLGVFVDSSGVTAAGGFMIQILPKAAVEEELVTKLESRVGHLAGFSTLLREGRSLPDIFEELMGDMGLHIFPEEQTVKFHCPCTKERMFTALKMLGPEELQDMIEKDGGAEATCHFCSEVYQSSVADLKNIIEEIRESEMAGR